MSIHEVPYRQIKNFSEPEFPPKTFQNMLQIYK